MNHLVTLYQLVKQRKMTHAMNFSTRKFGEIKVKCDISQWLQILQKTAFDYLLLKYVIFVSHSISMSSLGCDTFGPKHI